jgi:zinc protease
VVNFQAASFSPGNSVLIFTGDVSDAKAIELAQKYFGSWNSQYKAKDKVVGASVKNSPSTINRILVVDLPNSGQAAVNFTKNLQNISRTRQEYYFPASVLNSLLGGGYSSRLNQEIRIKRGLSYGAGSSFAWRGGYSNFGTRTQTKNESAAEVAELVLAEVKKLADGSIAASELGPRKSVLTGSFGRNLETTEGLAAAVADLYSFGLPASELNSYTNNVQSVSDHQIKDFAAANLMGGDIVIVGDYAKFKDDLLKRFPNMMIDVVKAENIDLSKENLRKE